MSDQTRDAAEYSSAQAGDAFLYGDAFYPGLSDAYQGMREKADSSLNQCW